MVERGLRGPPPRLWGVPPPPAPRGAAEGGRRARMAPPRAEARRGGRPRPGPPRARPRYRGRRGEEREERGHAHGSPGAGREPGVQARVLRVPEEGEPVPARLEGRGVEVHPVRGPSGRGGQDPPRVLPRLDEEGPLRPNG